MKRKEIEIIENELNDYEQLKNNLMKIRKAYSNLGHLEHKKADKLNDKNIFKHNHIDLGNTYIEFANTIIRLLNGDKIEDILYFISNHLKYLKEVDD